MTNPLENMGAMLDPNSRDGFGLAAEYFGLILARQAKFSLKTFGPGRRTGSILDHITKEMAEVRADPTDTTEWTDIGILSFDGAWRHIAFADEDSPPPTDAMLDDIGLFLARLYLAKLMKNESRKWPDWRTASPDQAIEHDRSGE